MNRTEYKNNTTENTLRMFTMKNTTLITGNVRSARSRKVSILFQLVGGAGPMGGFRSTHFTKVSICFN